MIQPESGVNTPEGQLRHPLEMLQPLHEWALHPPGNDRRTRAYALALANAIPKEPELQQVISSIVDFRLQRGRQTTPQYASYLIRDAIQYFSSGLPSFPELSESVAGWNIFTERILRHQKEDFEILASSLDILTVVPDREKGVQLYIAIHPGEFKGPVSILDVGTGSGAGLKGLVTHNISHELSVLIPESVPHPTIPGEHIPSSSFVEHAPVSGYVNRKLAQPIVFSEAVGVDILGINDPSLRKWRLNCLRPGELIDDDGGTRSQLEFLENLAVPNISFDRLDISDDGMVDSFHQKQNGMKFDIVTMITVLNQLNDEERVRAVANACRLGRKVLIQDFCQVTADGPRRDIAFFQQWTNYKYRTIVIDTEVVDPYTGLPALEPEEIFWWKDGRCREVVIAPSATNMGS